MPIDLKYLYGEQEKPKLGWVFALAVVLFTLLFSLVYIGLVKAEINLDIIATIESNNNPNAYNQSSGAVGMYQITAICLKDYNQLNKRQYQLNEMFDTTKAEKVARWYLNQRIPALLKHYHIADILERRLWCYNAGIKLCRKGIMPKETKEYIKKYKRVVY